MGSWALGEQQFVATSPDTFAQQSSARVWPSWGQQDHNGHSAWIVRDGERTDSSQMVKLQILGPGEVVATTLSLTPALSSLDVGRQVFAEAGMENKRCSREQLRFDHRAGALQVTVVGTKSSYVVRAGGSESDAEEIKQNERMHLLTGDTVYALRDKETSVLVLPIRVAAQPQPSASCVAAPIPPAAALAEPPAAPAPAAAASSQPRKRTMAELLAEEELRIKRNREEGLYAPGLYARGEGSMADAPPVRPGAPAAPPAPAAPALAPAPVRAPAPRAPPPPPPPLPPPVASAAEVISLDSDSDDDEVSIVPAPAPAPPPVPPPVPPPAPAPAPSGERAAREDGRRCLAAGVWTVRRGGKFVAYGSEEQSVLESAFRNGDDSAVISTISSASLATGAHAPRELYTVDFKSMRQLQLHNHDRWRPVRRDAADSAAATRAVADAAALASYKPSSSSSSSSAAPPAPPPAPAPAISGSSGSGVEVSAAAASHASQLAEIRRQRARAFKATAATAAATAPPPHTAPLHLLTYNLWFNHVHVAERMAAIGRIACGANGDGPCAIAVQELTPELHQQLSPHLRSGGYSPLTHQPWPMCGSNGHEQYGVGLTTRAPLSPLSHTRYHPYASSQMSRGLLMGVTAWGAKTLLLASTHLESWVGEEHNAIVLRNRSEQLAEAGREMVAEGRRRGCIGVVLLGDFNWQDNKDGDALVAIGPGWVDAFVQAGKPRGCASTCYQWRLDRCLVYTLEGVGRPAGGGGAGVGGGKVRVTSVALAGKEALPGLTQSGKGGSSKAVYPSDHKGVLVGFECD